MRKVDWMADIRAKTQSSDKTNPPECVGDDTVVSELLQHKATKPKGWEVGMRGRSYFLKQI